MTDQRTIQLHPQHFEIIEAFKTLGKAQAYNPEAFQDSLCLIGQTQVDKDTAPVFWAVTFARAILSKIE